MQRETTMLLIDNIQLIDRYAKDTIDLSSKVLMLLKEHTIDEDIEVFKILRKNLDIQILAENSVRLIKTL